MPSCREKSCTTTEEEHQRVHRPQETHPYVYLKIGLFTRAGQFINHKSASAQLTSHEAYRTCAEDWHARPGVTECFVNLGSKCFLPRVKLPTCTATHAELRYFLFPCNYIASLLLLCHDFIQDAPNAGSIMYSADNIHACELYFEWMPNIVPTFHNNCHQKRNKLCQALKRGEVVFLSYSPQLPCIISIFSDHSMCFVCLTSIAHGCSPIGWVWTNCSHVIIPPVVLVCTCWDLNYRYFITALLYADVAFQRCCFQVLASIFIQQCHGYSSIDFTRNGWLTLSNSLRLGYAHEH